MEYIKEQGYKIGNRKSMVEESQSVPTPGTHNYGYDVLNRLLSATHPQPENPPESFSYDPVGNRLTSHLSTLHRYDAANRLLEDDTYLYTYDNNGNLTEKTEKLTSSTTRYYYDAENQLIAINLPNGALAEYRYDGLGRRIQKSITPASGPVSTTRYIYDNEDILFEYDGANTLISRYTHGPGIDEPLIINRAGQDYFYHVDGLGSVKEITDSIGNIVQTYTYDSFGRIIAQTGSLTNPYTYTGREFDFESGLYYYRARYYDVNMGRFISEDPIGFAGSINLYRYVENNPVNLIDPDGLIPFDTIWDALNIVWDVVTGDWASLAWDTGALFIPYLPAGVTKACKISGKGLGAVLKDPKLFKRWLKRSHPVDKIYSADEAKQIWDKLKGIGLTPRLDPGHPTGKFWKGPHINVKVNGSNIHIPVDPEFKP